MIAIRLVSKSQHTTAHHLPIFAKGCLSFLTDLFITYFYFFIWECINQTNHRNVTQIPFMILFVISGSVWLIPRQNSLCAYNAIYCCLETCPEQSDIVSVLILVHIVVALMDVCSGHWLCKKIKYSWSYCVL